MARLDITYSRPRHNLIPASPWPDHHSVTHDLHYLENTNNANRLGPDGHAWSLRLTALSAEDPERLVRFLTGALLACGGWTLTRTTQGREAAELDFEFARACCVDVYAVLIAAGLELSRGSHLQLADLCHCTHNLIQTRAFEVVRADLNVYRSDSKRDQESCASAEG